MKKTILITVLSLLGWFSKAAVNPGDILPIGFGATGDESLQLLVLNAIPANSTIYLTSEDWNGTAFSGGPHPGHIEISTGSNPIPGGSTITLLGFNNTPIQIGISPATAGVTLSDLVPGMRIEPDVPITGYVGSQGSPTSFIFGMSYEVPFFGGPTTMPWDNTTPFDPNDFPGLTSSNTVHFVRNLFTFLPAPFGSGATGAAITTNPFDVNNWNNGGSWGNTTSIPANSGVTPNPDGTFPVNREPYVWNGSAWSNGAGGTGPPSSLDQVTINGFYDPSTDPTNWDYNCYDLTVNTGRTMLVDAGNTLTIGGDLDNNGTIVLRAQNATNYATFELPAETPTNIGTFTVEQYLQGPPGFHFLGASVSGLTYNSWNAGGQNYITAPYNNIYTWDAGTSNWVQPNNLNNAVPVGVGHAIYMGNFPIANYFGDINSGFTLSTTGTPVLADQTVTIPFSNGGASNAPGFFTTHDASKNGWNFISNPFPSTYFWDLTQMGGVITPAIYSYNNNNSTYRAYVNGAGTNGMTGYIAPMQAVFVRNNSGSSVNLTWKKANTVGNIYPTLLYKQSVLEGRIRVSVSNMQTGITDEAVVILQDNASSAMEEGLDAIKVLNPEASPSVYSLYPDNGFAINTTSIENITDTVPLGFSSASEGLHSLQVHFTDLGDNIEVFIIDYLSGKVYPTSGTYVQTFNHSGINPEKRFGIIFKQKSVLATEEIKEVNKALENVYVFNRLESHFLHAPLNTNVSIIDMNGKVVSQFTTTEVNMPLPTLPKGIYLLQLKNGRATMNMKWSK